MNGYNRLVNVFSTSALKGPDLQVHSHCLVYVAIGIGEIEVVRLAEEPIAEIEIVRVAEASVVRAVEEATDIRDNEVMTEDCVEKETEVREEDAKLGRVDEATDNIDAKETGNCVDEATDVRDREVADDCARRVIDVDRMVDTVTDGVNDKGTLKTLFKTVSSYAWIPVHPGISVRLYDVPSMISSAGAI